MNIWKKLCKNIHHTLFIFIRSKDKFKLASNYPRKVYSENEEQVLEDLGFFPNVNLFV